VNVIWWVQPDSLRLDDQPGLQQLDPNANLLVVFCYPVLTDWLDVGFSRRSQKRIDFEHQGLSALNAALKQYGQRLYISNQPAESLLAELARQLNARILTTEPNGFDEKQRLKQVRNRLEKINPSQLTICPGNSLFRGDLLPFDPSEPPGIFSQFRRQIERNQTPVAAPINPPAYLPPPPAVIPKPLTPFIDRPTARLRFNGGAAAAQQAMDKYLADHQAVLSYKQTRNALMGTHQSSQLSPWLAQGSLSVRRFWHSIAEFEHRIAANESTYWLKFELLWREFFRWITHAHGAKLFNWQGLSDKKPRGEQRFDLTLLARWQQGNTGFGLVDAGMRELAETGFTSNRARQNMASCLIHEMGLDWRLGAAWFEHCLLDYDVASNWGNWCYLAGVGNDPRPQRRFNLKKQAEIYDPKGLFQQRFLS